MILGYLQYYKFKKVSIFKNMDTFNVTAGKQQIIPS